jgi:hypothetical protein
MTKLAIGASILAIIGALGFATVGAAPKAPPLSTPNTPQNPGPHAPTMPRHAPAAGACVHTEFRTQLVEQACAKGGQAHAKAVMKTFMKDKKFKSCNQCHAKLAPTYELKADGVAQFTKAGGR